VLLSPTEPQSSRRRRPLDSVMVLDSAAALMDFATVPAKLAMEVIA
jgi:hypothetical protein